MAWFARLHDCYLWSSQWNGVHLIFDFDNGMKSMEQQRRNIPVSGTNKNQLATNWLVSQRTTFVTETGHLSFLLMEQGHVENYPSTNGLKRILGQFFM